jgi:hypothetical protein
MDEPVGVKCRDIGAPACGNDLSHASAAPLLLLNYNKLHRKTRKENGGERTVLTEVRGDTFYFTFFVAFV